MHGYSNIFSKVYNVQALEFITNIQNSYLPDCRALCHWLTSTQALRICRIVTVSHSACYSIKNQFAIYCSPLLHVKGPRDALVASTYWTLRRAQYNLSATRIILRNKSLYYLTHCKCTGVVLQALIISVKGGHWRQRKPERLLGQKKLRHTCGPRI